MLAAEALAYLAAGLAAERTELFVASADGQSRLRLILDQIPAIVSTLDTNLVFTSAQGAGMAAVPSDAAAMVGCTLAEVVGGDETSLPAVSARNVLAGTPMRYEWTWQG